MGQASDRGIIKTTEDNMMTLGEFFLIVVLVCCLGIGGEIVMDLFGSMFEELDE